MLEIADSEWLIAGFAVESASHRLSIRSFLRYCIVFGGGVDVMAQVDRFLMLMAPRMPSQSEVLEPDLLIEISGGQGWCTAVLLAMRG